MTVRIVRLGTPRAIDEGTRIGTVRRPPRGVPKTEFASQDWYDVWFPNLSPSEGLLKEYFPIGDDAARWRAFARRFNARRSAGDWNFCAPSINQTKIVEVDIRFENQCLAGQGGCRKNPGLVGPDRVDQFAKKRQKGDLRGPVTALGRQWRQP